LIAFVERQIPLVIYYGRVGLELSKIVFQAQKMAPPPMATFQGYFQNIVRSVRNPNSLLSVSADKAAQSISPNSILSSIRNMNTQSLVTGGVVLAEVLGFFTVGEIIGRMKLIGYRGETEHHH